MVTTDGYRGPGAGGPGKQDVRTEAVRPTSDTSTACHTSDRSGPATKAARSGGLPAKLEARVDEATRDAAHARANKLGLKPSVWQRSVIRDALDVRRIEEFDAALSAALAHLQDRSQASADAVRLAQQIRPLAINVNDLNRRARAGESVTLGEGVPELVKLLREVRELLGDKVAR